jgi:hypothetical protein
MYRTFFLGLLLIYTLHNPLIAQIVSGSDMLEMNSAISFHSDTVLHSKLASTIGGAPCALGVGSADIFFTSYDCGTCLHYCPCDEVGSVRPFYISEKSINQLGSETLIDLTDTANFKKIDTRKSCFYIPDSTACFLPSVAFNINMSSGRCRTFPEGKPIIVTTSDGNYAVVSINKGFGESCDRDVVPPQQDCHPFINALILHWFKQKNGSLSFKGILTEALSSGKRNSVEETDGKKINGLTHNANTGLFDILGRKVENLQLKSNRTIGVGARIFVNEKTCKVMLHF